MGEKGTKKKSKLTEEQGEERERVELGRKTAETEGKKETTLQ